MESYGYRTDDIVLQASDSEQFLFNADTQHLDTGIILYSIEMDVEYKCGYYDKGKWSLMYVANMDTVYYIVHPLERKGIG